MNYTINEIPDEAVELSGNEMIPIWQGETKKVSVATLAGYVQDASSYSTIETLTGGKWIDGKPIYKITKEGTNNFSNGDWTTITLFNDNVQKKVVKLDIACDKVCLRPEYLTITNTMNFSTSTGSGNGSTVSNVNYVLTIEYTKM